MYTYDLKTCTFFYPLPFPDSTRVCALPDAPDPPDFDASVSAMKIYTIFEKNLDQNGLLRKKLEHFGIGQPKILRLKNFENVYR